MEPDSFTKTSFCNVEIDNITTNEAKQYILNQMSIFCSGIKYNTRYAKVFNEKYSKNLNNPHIFCLKSSGTPYLLFLSQINGTNYCFLIDKKINDKYSFPKIMVVPYDFNSELYKGTLFECELIRDKESNWSIGINDIYNYKGKNVNNKVVIERLNIIHSIFQSEFTENKYSIVCPFFVKKYFDYKNLEYAINNFIPNLPYNTRGLYFVPMRTDYSKILYLFQKEQSLSENKKNYNKSTNKSNTKNTEKKIIFRIMKTLKPDVYELYLKDNENLVKYGNALIQTPEISHKILDFFHEKNPMDEIKVQCKLNTHFNKWVPIQLSNDNITSIYDL